MKLGTFAPPDSPVVDPLADTLRHVITTAAHTAPRSLQVALGPSEIGEPCARRLAYRLMDERRVNGGGDPWASIVGTAVHAWLAEACRAENDRLGRIRYLVEQRVEIRPGVAGSCDLYDADEATVIDHKVLGETTMRLYKRGGPPDQYRAQAHLYGLGLARLGLPVRRVALAMYPRAGLLSGLHLWSEPYDPAVADAAIARHDQILEAACALDVTDHPERYQHIPRTASRRCRYCPWYRPGADTGATCPGDTP
ncbi:hypothetical protein LX15_004779 [Streptoalloteichus tenebrarius]|uniref:PD-(D/E)XK endonuclease-like domain-containing protein n=1 Tax=Streptoalloteichus tenebrarius (strain ATCC 17920 / DSM 40477 / JCM 4838 / CBS 697.72 / NBRC 16177 / NCIMB 11028 / NRRL B-12390 / A12253. 1 / ISP 5477) TaxID=1933 RepID=A0ABT1HZV0_STRSD|nr:PD-(D/E)XK nuclease family protein [Streptoalloteichus tenebrarius]MCP2261059.1 hypothetical protein [Streptoalloteichus tenebrarius]BFF03146.1 hypothetical protein GCM10020241_48210 [Streptoalloteichus tenebrarius]